VIWLLRLYPPGWRRRYGEELADLISAQRFSIGTIIDVLAGAIDAWIDPQLAAPVRTTPAAEGGDNMFAKMMKLRCAGYGPDVTRADQWKSVGVMLGLTVVLSLAWMRLHMWLGDNPYVDSLSLMPFLAAFFISMRYTYLKGRSATTQAIFVVGNLALLTVFFLVAGWIAGRL
jgi:hypothetical protein